MLIQIKKQYPIEVHSVNLGLITFFCKIFDCICINKLLTVAPPSTFKDEKLI